MQSFWNFFINNYRITYLLLVGILVFGVVSIFQMPKESSPEVDIPIAVVTTTLPGAPAQDVEQLVTDPIEDQIIGMTDVEVITSSSATGFSQITVQFAISSDTDEAVSQLRNQVERAGSELPADAGDPTVQKVSLSDFPILSLSVSGPYDSAEIKRFAEIIEDEAESVGSVSRANVLGAPTEIVEVSLNQSQLAQHGLTPLDVVTAIQQASSDVPVGSITTDSGVYNLRFSGRLTTVSDVQQVPVSTSGGAIVLVEDIANVQRSFQRQDVVTQLSTEGQAPQSAISVQIFKESGEGNILSISDEIDERIAAITGSKLPEDLVIEKTQSDAELIRTDLSNLLTSGIITMIVIFVLLLLFLGWREALMASLSVPTTFLIAFIALNYLGLTINFLTLFSLILALGILVDAAIVVTESISSYLQAGKSAIEAARSTVKEFARPLTAGTLTTVFVFFPMLLTGGIIGEYIKSIPITVTVVLLAALFVALGIITTLTSRLFAGQKSTDGHGLASNSIGLAYKRYSSYIDKLLTNRRRGKRFLVTISVLFVLTLSFPFVGIVALELFPQSDMDSLTINLEMPVGTPLKETIESISTVEDFLREEAVVESFATTIGSPVNPGSLTTGSAKSHIAGIAVNLREDRDLSSMELTADFESELSRIVTEGKVTLSQLDSGPEQGQPVQMQVIGDDLAALEAAAEVIAERLEGLPGTRNVESGVVDTGGDFVLTVDSAQAKVHGVSAQQVAVLLRAAVSGLDAVTLKEGGEDTDVVVIYDIAREDSNLGSVRTDVEAIEGINIQTPQGSVPLSTLVDVSLGRGQTTINHDDGERVIGVSSGVTADGSAQVISGTILREYNAGELELPEGVRLSFGGEAEDIQESFTDLFMSMIIGVLLIFGLLVWLFKSYKTSLIMLATIPLAFIGVFAGLAITFQPLSFPAFIGVVALAGIVVNNAIILIDRINLNKEEGVEHVMAIKQAAQSRLQPILLTTITTVGGMLPLAFADPAWAPLAWAVIFGLLFSTILTLVVVPLLYQRYGR